MDLPGKPVNTFSPQMFDELTAAIEQIEHDTPGAVIFASAKPRSFMAGADLFEIRKMNAEQLAEYLKRGQTLFSRIAALSMPTIAAINGDCLGGGCELSLACTYRVAVDDTSVSIGLPEVKLGLIPAWGGTTRLPRLLGLRNALPILLAGKTMPPRKAQRVGLVDEVVRREALLAAAKRIVLSKAPPHRPGRMDRAADKLAVARNRMLGAGRRKTLETTYGNYPAPLSLLNVVRTGSGGIFSVTGSHTYALGFGGPGSYGSTLCDASLPHFNAPIVTTIHHESATPSTANSTANFSAPANSAFLTSDGNLLVIGTPGNDQIQFTPDGNSGRVNVRINCGKKLGPFQLGANGRIVVAALGGNDSVQVPGAITKPSVLYGGPGNDLLNGGNGRAILVGCSGNDTLVGGSADDLLIGDSGADNLNGNAGNDALVAGSTTDDYLTLLSYQANYNLLIGNVADDGARDILTGAAGTDTFFARLTGPNKDVINGPSEVLRLI